MIGLSTMEHLVALDFDDLENLGNGLLNAYNEADAEGEHETALVLDEALAEWDNDSAFTEEAGQDSILSDTSMRIELSVDIAILDLAKKMFSP